MLRVCVTRVAARCHQSSVSLTERRKSMVHRGGCLERVAFLGSFVGRLQSLISPGDGRALQTGGEGSAALIASFMRY